MIKLNSKAKNRLANRNIAGSKSTQGMLLCICLMGWPNFGCGTTKKKEKPKDAKSVAEDVQKNPNFPSGFLTAEELKKPDNLVAEESQNIGSVIQSESAFFPENTLNAEAMDAAKNSETAETDCNSQKLKELPISYKDHWVTYQGSLDLMPCLQKQDGQMAITTFKMTVFGAFYLDRYTGDGTEFQGKKVADIGALLPKALGATGTFSSRNMSQIKIDAEYAAPGSNGGQRKYRSISATMGSKGGACEGSHEDDVESYSDCVHIKSMVWDKPGEESLNQYSKLQLVGVKGTTSAKYFESGAIEFEINQWNGKVTFTGKDQSPKWQAKNGANVIEGILKAQQIELPKPATTPATTKK